MLLMLFTAQGFCQLVIPYESQIDPKAELKVYSADKGVLLPRIQGLNMLTIKEPATGLWLFNTSEKCFYFYSGTNWQQMSETPEGTPPAPFYKGEMMYSSTDKKIKYWDGAAWISIGTL